MGEMGTEVAKEASEIILTERQLWASIEAAVEEGRTVYLNLKKVVAFFAAGLTAANWLTILAAVLMGAALPILPLQISLGEYGQLQFPLRSPEPIEPKPAGVMQKPRPGPPTSRC